VTVNLIVNDILSGRIRMWKKYTCRPTALLCMLTRCRFEVRFLFHGVSVNHLLKITPKPTSSPHPPHLKSPGGGSFGSGPQLHFADAPELHALAIDCVRAAAASAYTYDCSRLPAVSQLVRFNVYLDKQVILEMNLFRQSIALT